MTIVAREVDMRGSSRDRRRRKQWMLDHFGDGVVAPCTFCGKPLDFDSITTDRIIPGSQGGRYTRDNIQPACSRDNKRRQDVDDPDFRTWYEEFLGDITTTGQMSMVDPLPVVDNSYRHVATSESDTELLLQMAEETGEVITPFLQDIAREHGGDMKGLENKIKSHDSLLRKLKAKEHKYGRPLDPFNDINDALRYTMELPTEQYVEGANSTLEKIRAQGWEIKELENSWTPGDPYSGLHAIVNIPDGINFELQFHTPQSYHTKDVMNHAKYERFRDPDTPLEEKQDLYEEMAQTWDEVPVPEGVHEVGDYLFYPFPLSTRIRAAKIINPSGFMMVQPRTATNWTLDGLPIEDGFDVLSNEERAEQETNGLGLQSLARTASRQPTSSWVKAAGDDYWTDVTDDDHLLEVAVDQDGLYEWSTMMGEDTIASGREDTLVGAQDAAHNAIGVVEAKTAAKTWTVFWDDQYRRKDKWTLIEADGTHATYHRLNLADDFGDALAEAEKISGIDSFSWDEMGVNPLNNEGFARKVARRSLDDHDYDVDIESLSDTIQRVTVRDAKTQDVIRTLHVSGPNAQDRIEEMLEEIANGPRIGRVAASDDYMESWWTEDAHQIVVGQLVEEGAVGNVASEDDWDEALADAEMTVKSFIEDDDWDAIGAIYQRAMGWNPAELG